MQEAGLFIVTAPPERIESRIDGSELPKVMSKRRRMQVLELSEVHQFIPGTRDPETEKPLFFFLRGRTSSSFSSSFFFPPQNPLTSTLLPPPPFFP